VRFQQPRRPHRRLTKSVRCIFCLVYSGVNLGEQRLNYKNFVFYVDQTDANQMFDILQFVKEVRNFACYFSGY
jgi:hypothetical protein